MTGCLLIISAIVGLVLSNRLIERIERRLQQRADLKVLRRNGYCTIHLLQMDFGYYNECKTCALQRMADRNNQLQRRLEQRESALQRVKKVRNRAGNL